MQGERGGGGKLGGGEGAKQIIIAHTTPLAVIRLRRGLARGIVRGGRVWGGRECRRGGGGWGGGSGVCPPS